VTIERARRHLPEWMEKFRYEGPVGEGPAGWTVEVVEPDPLLQLQYTVQGRHPGDGPFYVLRHDGSLWMSDTDAEIRDHVSPVVEANRAGSEARVLIHGLGMGLVTAAMLRQGAEHVDVVEIDGDLIDWMGPWLTDVADLYGGTVEFHQANVFEMKWPSGSRWHVVWHDIWPEMSEGNLPDMHWLHRSFGRRCVWQGSWGRERIEYERNRSGGWW